MKLTVHQCRAIRVAVRKFEGGEHDHVAIIANRQLIAAVARYVDRIATPLASRHEFKNQRVFVLEHRDLQVGGIHFAMKPWDSLIDGETRTGFSYLLAIGFAPGHSLHKRAEVFVQSPSRFSYKSEAKVLGREVNSLARRIEVLRSRMQRLEIDRLTLLSKEFIEKHNITKADVFTPPPCTHMNAEFIARMRTRTHKEKFIDWNGTLHYRKHLADGKFLPTPAFSKDLKR